MNMFVVVVTFLRTYIFFLTLPDHKSSIKSNVNPLVLISLLYTRPKTNRSFCIKQYTSITFKYLDSHTSCFPNTQQKRTDVEHRRHPCRNVLLLAGRPFSQPASQAAQPFIDTHTQFSVSFEWRLCQAETSRPLMCSRQPTSQETATSGADNHIN